MSIGPNNPQRDSEREKQGGQNGQPQKQGSVPGNPGKQDQSQKDRSSRKPEKTGP
jgi:hypothetical protein